MGIGPISMLVIKNYLHWKFEEPTIEKNKGKLETIDERKDKENQLKEVKNVAQDDHEYSPSIVYDYQFTRYKKGDLMTMFPKTFQDKINGSDEKTSYEIPVTELVPIICQKP